MLRAWWRVVTGPVSPGPLPAEDDGLIAAAAELLPPEPWDEGTFGAWASAIKAATGRKGRALFMPLRQALTGFDHGPELAALLPLIGRRDTLARLAAVPSSVTIMAAVVSATPRVKGPGVKPPNRLAIVSGSSLGSGRITGSGMPGVAAAMTWVASSVSGV